MSPRRARLEWAGALAAALVAIAVVCYAGRDTWFRIDVWDFLMRSQDGSLQTWVRPHGGHLQLPAVALHRLLYATAGMDFWPWYYLPHVLGYAGLILFLWRILLRRGAERTVAFAAYLVLLFLGVAAFLSSIAVGSLIVVAALLVVAERIDADAAPSTRVRLVVAGALLLMVISSSLGVAGLLAALVVAAASRRLGRWWWCFLPAVAAYGAWYLAYGGESTAGIGWGYLRHLPSETVRLLGSTVQELTGVGGRVMVWGAVSGLLLGAALVWLAWRRRLRRWDWILLGTVACYVLMILAVRASSGYSVEQNRYSYNLIILATPLLVPHLHFGKRWPAAARLAVLAVVAGYLLGYNVWQRLDLVNRIEYTSLRSRAGVEAVAAVLGDGEPAIDDLRLGGDLLIPATAGLRVGDLRPLLADGWVPPPADPALVASLRPALRIHDADGIPADGAGAPFELPGVGLNGCVVLKRGEPITAEVLRTGWFALRLQGRQSRAGVELTWRDQFGEFKVNTILNRGRAIQLAAPVGETHLTIRSGPRRVIRVCGFDRPGG